MRKAIQGKIKGLVQNQFKKMKIEDEKLKDTGNSEEDSVEEGKDKENTAEETSEEIEDESSDY